MAICAVDYVQIWQYSILDKRIIAIQVTMKTLNQQSDACRGLMQVPGIGQLNTSAFVATIGRGQQFARGRDLSAWLGLVPQQNSSGTRTRVGRITKRGDSYLRHILIHRAVAHVVRVAARADNPSPPERRFSYRCYATPRKCWTEGR